MVRILHLMKSPNFVPLFSDIPVQASLVGLAISQCMILIGVLQYGMRQTAEMTNQLTSVERILEYTTIESEGCFVTPKGKVQMVKDTTKLFLLFPDDMIKNRWPKGGRIEFRNLSLKYIQTDPPVLKNLNVTIEPGEKVISIFESEVILYF